MATMFVYVGVSVIALFGCKSAKPEPSVASEEVPSVQNPPDSVLTLDSLKGYWLDAEYLHELELTRSPLKAFSRKKSIVPEIYIHGMGISWLYNFHEGDGDGFVGLRSDSSSGVFRFRMGRDREDSQHELRIIRGERDTAIWILPTGEPAWFSDTLKFVRIDGDLYEFINQIVIVGSYKDVSGEVYKFSKDGVLIWPQLHGEYQLGLEVTEPGPDEIYINRGSLVLGYRFAGRKLLLFPTEEQEGEFATFKRDPSHTLDQIE